MVTEKDVLKEMDNPDSPCPIVVVKEKKKGGYTVYPQVTELKCINVPLLGPAWAFVFKE